MIFFSLLGTLMYHLVDEEYEFWELNQIGLIFSCFSKNVLPPKLSVIELYNLVISIISDLHLRQLKSIICLYQGYHWSTSMKVTQNIETINFWQTFYQSIDSLTRVYTDYNICIYIIITWMNNWMNN